MNMLRLSGINVVSPSGLCLARVLVNVAPVSGFHMHRCYWTHNDSLMLNMRRIATSIMFSVNVICTCDAIAITPVFSVLAWEKQT